MKKKQRRKRTETMKGWVPVPSLSPGVRRLIPKAPHARVSRKRHAIKIRLTLRGELCEGSFASSPIAHREIGKRVRERVRAALSPLHMVYDDFRIDSRRVWVGVTADRKKKPKKKYKGAGEYSN
jgi:hypothetical protein